ELAQQQALYAAQAAAACACAQAPHIAHVLVVAVKFVDDRIACRRGLRNGSLFAKQFQEMVAGSTQFRANAYHGPGTVASRQVLAEKLFDDLLVQQPDSQTML